jgi:hypothetical protein
MSDILEFFEKASLDDYGQKTDGIFLRSMSGSVPTNSGIQSVFPNIQLSKLLASQLHWKFRPIATSMAKSSEYGISALSSENGFGVKSLNTIRQEQHFSSKNGTSQKPDSWDRYVYGKSKFENNDNEQ